MIWAQILTMSLWNMNVNNSDLVASMKMHIKYKSLSRTCLISYHSGDYKKDRKKRSDRNHDQPNEYSRAGKSENKKNNDTLSAPAVLWIVSVFKENADRERKKGRTKERKKQCEYNTN